MMKKFFYILFCLFLFLPKSNVHSQHKQSNSPVISNGLIVHVDNTGYSYDWKLSNEGCYGCGSFYIRVVRTAYPDESGKYYFYVQFWSNSFYLNGKPATSYVFGVRIYLKDGYGNSYLVLGPSYILSEPNALKTGATLYSLNKYQQILITWDGVSPY